MKLLWINKYKIVLSSSSHSEHLFPGRISRLIELKFILRSVAVFFCLRRRRKTIEDCVRAEWTSLRRLGGRCALTLQHREEISFIKTKESVYGWIIIMESSETCRSTGFFNSHCDSKRHSVISWLRGMRLMLWLHTLYSERAAFPQALTETEIVRATHEKGKASL